MENAFSLVGKTVLVTGASSGIGRSTVLACAAAGATCILIGRNKDRLAETLHACVGNGHSMHSVEMTDSAALKELVERLPPLDGLVQCAGVGDNQTPVKFLSAEFIDKILSINLKAPMLFLALLEKKKKLNKGASVVMISSVAAFFATPAHSLYMASKAGLSGFVRGAALDLSGKKIRVNAIAPAMVRTPLIESSSVTDEQQKANEATYPLGHYGEPRDVANAVIYLLSDASVWVTGTQMVLDGGKTLS